MHSRDQPITDVVNPGKRARWLRLVGVGVTAVVVALIGPFAVGEVETFAVYPRPPPEVDFAHAPAQLLAIADEERGVVAHALFLRAQLGKPTIVVFHGNGDQLSGLVAWLGTLEQHGLGGFAIEYPGYGPSAAEEPTEQSVYLHAEVALLHLRGSLGVETAATVLLGESLGSGVAVEMASRGHGTKLILLSPFTSLDAVAEFHLPWVPARWVMRNRYDSIRKAPSIRMPVVVLHGTADGLIPVAMGRELAERFPESEFVPLQGAGHGGLLYSHAEPVLDALRH